MRIFRGTTVPALMALAASGLGVLLMAAPAQAYPVDTGALSVSAGELEPGAATKVSGSGFVPGASIEITVESAPVYLTTVTADGQGAFSTTVTIPAGLPHGPHALVATGPTSDGGTLVLRHTFVVGGADSGALPVVGGTLPVTGGGTLPTTGYPIGLLASLSGAVLLGGIGVVACGIRRRVRLSGPASDRDVR